MSSWTTTTIGEIAEEVFDGPHATPTRIDEGPIFLGISSLVDGRLDLSQSDHVSEEDFEKWTRRVTPRAGDLVFSYETRLGEAALIPEGIRCCLGRRMGLIRPDRRRIIPRYLLYVYLSPQFQDTIHTRTVHGSTVNRILLTEFPDYPLTITTDLDEQRRIAEVLGVLDDKIELNRQMNATLETTAQALFEHFFEGTLDSSDVGFADLVEMRPKLRLSRGEVYTYVGMAALDEHSMNVHEDEIRPKEYKGGARFQNGDTLLARITPSLENGKTAYVDFLDEGEIGFGSTEFIVLRACEGVTPRFVYCCARNDTFRRHAIRSMVGSSGRQRVQLDALEKFGFAGDPREVMDEFDAAVAPLFERVRANTLETHTLAQLRDTLLPKLISGEIRVSEAEELVEEVA